MIEVPVARNLPGNIRERKLRDTLCTSGIAVMAFGAWSAIKSVIQVSNTVKPLIEVMQKTATTEEEIALAREAMQYSSAITWILVGLALAIGLVEILIRCYIGNTARRVGRGMKPITTKWLVFSVILFLLEIAGLIYEIISLESYLLVSSITDYIVTLFVMATSLYATWELLSSAFSLKKLLNKAAE